MRACGFHAGAAMSFVVAHITDTHLSAEKPYFVANFERFGEHLRRAAPDLVVNTGDISVNGADSRDDLVAARDLHDALGLSWRAIPGNHDIGDNQETAKKQPIDAERHARYLDVFGEDRWVIDVPGWRLLGVNALLLGSDLAQASEQERFIADAVAGLDGRPLALFLHKPLFFADPGEADPTHLTVSPGPRQRLFDALGAVRPRVVCSGHLHEYRESLIGDMHHVWAPGTSFTVPGLLPTHGGEHTVGYVEIAFAADGSFESRFVRPGGVDIHDLADFPGAYGDLRRIKAAIAE